MLDQNDLQAIAQLIGNLEKQIDSKMDNLEKRMDSKLEKQRDDILEVIQQQSETTQAMISESEQRMKVYMENQVGKRIDSHSMATNWPMKSNGNLKERLSNWKNAWKLWKQRPVNFYIDFKPRVYAPGFFVALFALHG